mmetsp:Transcript_15083/g.45560  ORF Transcript_15083/g.45560 Transcript_15083/m.45560 type:complete len:228 (+) Transcript_15083:245-928(+)
MCAGGISDILSIEGSNMWSMSMPYHASKPVLHANSNHPTSFSKGDQIHEQPSMCRSNGGGADCMLKPSAGPKGSDLYCEDEHSMLQLAIHSPRVGADPSASESLLGENTFGGGNHALPAGVNLAGLPQGAGERLERGLHNVVAVLALQLPDVQGHARGVGQGAEEMLHHLRVEGANALCGNVHIEAQVWPPRQIQYDINECLVQRCTEVAKAADALPVSQRLTERCA